MPELKSFKDLCDQIKIGRKEDKIRHKKQSQDKKVEAGGIRYEPIDRVAARVIAPAPWHCKPVNVPPSQKQEIQEMTDTNTNMDALMAKYAKKITTVLRTNMEGLISVDSLDEMLIEAVEEALPAELKEMTEGAINARRMIRACTEDLGQDLGDLYRATTDARERLRNDRMTLVRECGTISNALRDVRQFFLGPDHKREVARLEEFVSLCERLNALKESGFLDSVADTMLRLSSVED